MDARSTTSAEPVFWWWEEDECSRIVLLTEDRLILSGPLTETEVGRLEHARRSGGLDGADFGPDARSLAVADIARLRFHPDGHRLVVTSGDGDCTIAPPRTSAGVALGLFDSLAKRVAPGREPVDSAIDGPRTESEPALTAVGAFVVIGLVCLGLAVAADQGEPAGPLAGFRSSLNEVFESFGYLPAMVAFALAGVIQIIRMRRSSTAADAPPVTERTLELVVDPPPDQPGHDAENAAAADPLADIASPPSDADAVGSSGVDSGAMSGWSSDADAVGGWSSPSDAEAVAGWSPPPEGGGWRVRWVVATAVGHGRGGRLVVAVGCGRGRVVGC